MVPPMKFRASPLPVNMCVATEMEDDICKDFKKLHANSSLQRQIISQIRAKAFRSQSRGSLVDSVSDSHSWLVATTPGDSNSDSCIPQLQCTSLEASLGDRVVATMMSLYNICHDSLFSFRYTTYAVAG